MSTSVCRRRGSSAALNRDFSDAVANVNLLNRTDEIYTQIVEHLKLKPTPEEQARAARPTDKSKPMIFTSRVATTRVIDAT